MPNAFVHLDPALFQACADSVVLTPNERLRREMLRGFAQIRQKSEKKAWRTARIFSFSGFLQHRYVLARQRDPTLPALLANEAESLLWQRVLPPDLRAFVGLAQNAWELALAWGIHFDEQNFSHTDDARSFLRWARHVRRDLAASHAITRAELSAKLSEIEHGAPERITCIEFESISPAQQAYFDRLESTGCQIERRNVESTRPAAVKRVELVAESEEINACAWWCSNILASTPEAQIGVVIPNLSNRYNAIARQFAAVLNPDGKTNLVDLAGGTHLAEQPIWISACHWLRLCFDQLPYPLFNRLLTSPYLALPEIRQLPVTLPEQFSIHELVRNLDHKNLDPHFVTLASQIRHMPDEQAFSAWVGDFLDVLSRSGWGATHTGSTQFQAYEHLIECIESLACQQQSLRCNAVVAIAILQQTLAEQTFAAEHSPAPIQIMGYLETTGLRFSHLWIAGLHEAAWPPTPSTNPFIPHSVQRANHLPRIDYPSELEFARARIEHWHRSTRSLIFSHVIDNGESPQHPSVLTSHLPTTPVTSLLVKYHPASHPYFVPRKVPLEVLEDTSGTHMAPGLIRGGAAVLRDQAGCPFRAWSIHRLGLRESRAPHAFPDALDRGILVHEALHRLLSDTEDQASIEKLDIQTVTAVAHDTVADLYRRFPRSYRDQEIERLSRVLNRWLLFERTRTPFQIVGLEVETSLKLSGFELSLRMDRIDRIGKDALIVIDYKTGVARSSRLTGAPLLEPQLPVYAVTSDKVAAVCFARVGERVSSLAGVGEENLNLKPARMIPLPAGGFLEVRATWERQLEEILSEFKSGYAAVSPRDSSLCRSCHLAALCRIDVARDTASE